MAKLLKVSLGFWLAGMLASGSAFATTFDLGVLTPGPGSFQALGQFIPPGSSFDDIYAFDIGGSGGTVGASVVSLIVHPGSPATLFDISAQLFAWDTVSSSFIPLTGVGTGPAVFLSADVPVASGGNGTPPNRHYQVELTGTPGNGPLSIASYGGSLSVAAVPEPSTVLLLIGGMISAAVLGRRRLATAAV